jgi:hypothetical protein
MMTQGTRIMLDMNDTIDRGVYADIFRPSEGPLRERVSAG